LVSRAKDNREFCLFAIQENYNKVNAQLTFYINIYIISFMFYN